MKTTEISNDHQISMDDERVLGSVSLEYYEVKEPKEIEYFQLFMKYPDVNTPDKWFMCTHSTNFDWVKEQEKWWKSQIGNENNEFRIFSIRLPY